MIIIVYRLQHIRVQGTVTSRRRWYAGKVCVAAAGLMKAILCLRAHFRRQSE